MNVDKTHGCKCRHCGIELITQGKSSDTYCRFCGAPALLAADFENTPVPELALPFEVSKSQARQIFSRHLSQRPLSASALFQKVKSGFIREIYIPVSVGDLEITTEIKAIDNGGNTVTKQIVSSAGNTNACMSNMFDGYLYGLLGKYDFSRTVAYDEALAKIPFERSAESSHSSPMDELETESVRVAMESLGNRENIKKVLGCQKILTKQNCKTVLVPVWVLSNISHSYSSRIFINGQNGKIIGETPVSVKKALAIFGGIAAACTLIGELIWTAVNGL